MYIPCIDDIIVRIGDKYLSTTGTSLAIYAIFSKLLSSYCAPDSFYGLMTSFVSVGSPICVTLLLPF